MDGDRTILIGDEGDIVAARHAGRVIALELGFSSSDATVVAAAIS